MTGRPSRTTSVTTATVDAVICEKSIQALRMFESIRAGSSTMSMMRMCPLTALRRARCSVAYAAQRARVVDVAHRRRHLGQRADRLHEFRHRQEAVRRRAEDHVGPAQPALEIARRHFAAGVFGADLRRLARMRFEELRGVEKIAVECLDELRVLAGPFLVDVHAVERVLPEDVEAA